MIPLLIGTIAGLAASWPHVRNVALAGLGAPHGGGHFGFGINRAYHFSTERLATPSWKAANFQDRFLPADLKIRTGKGRILRGHSSGLQPRKCFSGGGGAEQMAGPRAPLWAACRAGVASPRWQSAVPSVWACRRAPDAAQRSPMGKAADGPVYRPRSERSKQVCPSSRPRPLPCGAVPPKKPDPRVPFPYGGRAGPFRPVPATGATAAAWSNTSSSARNSAAATSPTITYSWPSRRSA